MKANRLALMGALLVSVNLASTSAHAEEKTGSALGSTPPPEVAKKPASKTYTPKYNCTAPASGVGAGYCKEDPFKRIGPDGMTPVPPPSDAIKGKSDAMGKKG